jgi:hypothetical protein
MGGFRLTPSRMTRHAARGLAAALPIRSLRHPSARTQTELARCVRRANPVHSVVASPNADREASRSGRSVNRRQTVDSIDKHTAPLARRVGVQDRTRGCRSRTVPNLPSESKPLPPASTASFSAGRLIAGSMWYSPSQDFCARCVPLGAVSRLVGRFPIIQLSGDGPSRLIHCMTICE